MGEASRSPKLDVGKRTVSLLGLLVELDQGVAQALEDI